MIVRHATLASNLPSIRKSGLLASKSRGKLKAVWLHTAARSAWATLHTVSRHGGTVENVVVLVLDVPRSWLRRSKRGLWYCTRDIPAARWNNTLSFAVLSRSQVESDDTQKGGKA